MDPEIAACGLYCGACRKYLKYKCPGCHPNEKASWCEIRTCCREHGWQSCAECDLTTLNDCKKFNSFVGKVFKVLFRSDRTGCIARIREIGTEAFAEEMRRAESMNRPVNKKKN